MGAKAPRYRIQNREGAWVITKGPFHRKVWHTCAFVSCPTELLEELNGPARADVIAALERRSPKVSYPQLEWPRKPKHRRGSRK